ncbi:hypothetical protein NDU88_010344 [Pleurodeles waltl]|uniref:Uncharacterized protein n=1 Tax=Pleurodeles waltl TaxID=8319 RepID=A0AAV7PVP9_PLEWA|nr:hypothetical protein NDU88_010344 [Pleurodeles waltl]
MAILPCPQHLTSLHPLTAVGHGNLKRNKLPLEKFKTPSLRQSLSNAEYAPPEVSALVPLDRTVAIMSELRDGFQSIDACFDIITSCLDHLGERLDQHLI